MLVGLVTSVSSIGICFGSPYTAAVDENTIFLTSNTKIGLYLQSLPQKYIKPLF